MTKKVNTPETDVIVDAKGKLELLFEKYGKKLLIVLAVVGVAVGGYFIYKNYAEKKEQERIAKSKKENTMILAKGDADAAAAFADNKEFAETAAHNYANLLAAQLYLDENDVNSAEKYIAKFKEIDGGDLPYLANMINAQACGVRGDIAVEKGNYEAAVAEFKSALAKSADKSTFIYFNHKLARLYAKMDKGQEAMGCYNAIDEKYPNEGFEAEL